MHKYQFNKLVRSKIIKRMQQEGVIVHHQQLDSKRYQAALFEKLLEEAKEVTQHHSHDNLIEELGDLAEVMEAIKKAHNISSEEITQAQNKKAEINGIFTDEHYIDYAEVAPENTKVINYLAQKYRRYIND